MMARIVAPNKEYAGISAGVLFRGGEGHTDSPYLVEWFRTHDYTVIEDKPDNQTENKPAETKPKRKRKGA